MIQRYDSVIKGSYASYHSMDPDTNGDWCRWDDVEAELKLMAAVVEAARKARKWTESQTANDFCDEMEWEQEMGHALAALDASKGKVKP